jgi:hypothetical protein
VNSVFTTNYGDDVAKLALDLIGDAGLLAPTGGAGGPGAAPQVPSAATLAGPRSRRQASR